MVSVIIPIYNCQKYIERCIRSLLEQDYTNIEIITVDDGSTDQSADIIKKLQEEDGRIKYLYQENSGPGVARNKAVKQAKGKYLLFVDADDYVSTDYISDLVHAAEENSAELTIGGYTLIYEDSDNENRVVPKRYVRHTEEEWAYRISSCWSRLYLKKFWDENNILFQEEKEARAEDVPVVLYSNAMAENITIVKNSGYYYYQHQGSAMNSLAKKVVFKFPYKAFEEMYHKIRNTGIVNSGEYFDFGILKFLAHFEFVIYHNAAKKEKEYFQNFLCELLKDDFGQMVVNWKKIKTKMDLPLTHKVAIHLFIMKHRRNIGNK